MIDVSAFRIERERLRRFCFQQTTATVVIRDVASLQLDDPRSNPTTRLAELLQFLLIVDAERFADPDDDCEDFGPSLIAVPNRPSTKRDVATTLDACQDQAAPVIIDYRVSEIVWPLVAPHLIGDKLRQIKLWDRELHQRRRIGGIITLEAAADDIAILVDGGSVLRRRSGQTLDIGGGFWRTAHHEIASQRCMRRAWQRSAFETKGNA